jgi:hypothetical protein
MENVDFLIEKIANKNGYTSQQWIEIIKSKWDLKLKNEMVKQLLAIKDSGGIFSIDWININILNNK